MKHDSRITALIEKSRIVLRDCALENGAIVAANTDKSYTPREASNYRSVWPRDAAFVAAAARLLQMPAIGETFLAWLEEKPEGFRKERLLYHKYSTNGRAEGSQFQADQMGTVLWLIGAAAEGKADWAAPYRSLVERLANGLVAVWNGTFFTRHVTDLWEEEYRHTSHTMQNNFTYTIAACARGLLAADTLFPNPVWKEAATQMVAKVQEAYSERLGRFLRNHGRVDDENVDASLLGLVWPFAICDAADPRMVRTVAAIERVLAPSGGVHRYQFDYYDGEGSASEGGGAWPILNFWMTLYFLRAGDRAKAERYYAWVLDRVGQRYHGYLPEQVFDDERVGIYPLAWSHAMFVFASHELGYC